MRIYYIRSSLCVLFNQPLYVQYNINEILRINIFIKNKHSIIQPVACAGFILAGAENFFRGGRKKIRGGRIAPEESEIFFCPPPRQNSILPLGQNKQEGGGRKPLNTKSINTNISHQFLDYTITFVN